MTKDNADRFEKVVLELSKRNKEGKPKKKVRQMDPALYDKTKMVITNNLLEIIDKNDELDAERKEAIETMFPRKHEIEPIEFDGDTKLIDQYPNLKTSIERITQSKLTHQCCWHPNNIEPERVKNRNK